MSDEPEALTPAKWIAQQTAVEAREIRDLAYVAREAMVQWTLEQPDHTLTPKEYDMITAFGGLLVALGVRKPRLTVVKD
jgi:hypothetical protein